MVSLATRQTPLYMVKAPRAGVLSSIWGVWRVAKLTIPRPSTVGAHSLHFNVHIVERTFLRSWTRMVLSSFFTIFQSVDPLSTARGYTFGPAERHVLPYAYFTPLMDAHGTVIIFPNFPKCGPTIYRSRL